MQKKGLARTWKNERLTLRANNISVPPSPQPSPIKGEGVSLTIKGRIARIEFRHPPLNIFTLPLLHELKTAVKLIRQDPRLLAVVFSSNNPKVFSAGVAVQDHYPDKALTLFRTFHDIFRTLWSWDKLSVAVVDGLCLGGGCELALSSDLIIASTRTQFGLPEISVGCFPPMGVIRLPSPVRFPLAMELILSGRRFSVKEALQFGMVNRAVPSSQLQRTTQNLLDSILKHSPIVIKKTIQAMRIHTKKFIPLIAESERIYLKQLLKTHDAIEGLDAFLQKRPPKWRGQ